MSNFWGAVHIFRRPLFMCRIIFRCGGLTDDFDVDYFVLVQRKQCNQGEGVSGKFASCCLCFYCLHLTEVYWKSAKPISSGYGYKTHVAAVWIFFI